MLPAHHGSRSTLPALKPPPTSDARSPRKSALSRIGRAYLSLALGTSRWNITGNRSAAALLHQTGSAPPGAIVAFWHRALLQLPALWLLTRRGRNHLRLRVLISRNRDGRLINDTVAPWGIIGIAGSANRKGKDKGGAHAFREAISALRAGSHLAITPDGPRGPVGVIQPGVLRLARVTGRTIVPVGAACDAFHLPSWDRLAVPLPFGRGELVLGAPLDAETTSEALAKALNDAARAAERRLSLVRATTADRLWAALGNILRPLVIAMLRIRLARGREIRGRLRERMGLSRAKRPAGTLLWLHAASVGECRSALPLIDALLDQKPELNVLVTTATVTGAQIVEAHRLSSSTSSATRILHQFTPYDIPRWNRRFLARWRPDAALLVESELWPGMIAACFRRGIPIAVINARLSDRSWRQWRRFRSLGGTMFARLDFVAARSAEDARRFQALGVPTCHTFGDLKQSAPPPPVDKDVLAGLKRQLGGRPVFLAAATHPGEDEIIADAAGRMRRSYPDLLCIIVPRHPVRGTDIAARLGHAPRRALAQVPTATDSFWIADTLGELGLFYRLATVAWIGNSLAAPGGGHNPFEAVRLHTPLASGPYVDNFKPAFARLEGCIAIVKDSSTLADWGCALLADPARRERLTAEAATRIDTPDTVPAPLLTRIVAMLPQ